MTACSPQTDQTSSAAPVLTMATSADFPPYGYVDTSSGTEKIIGFDIDIATTIATQLGYTLEITNIDFNGLIPALLSKRADFVMAGMVPTAERKENVDFSNIYYEAKSSIVSKQGSGLSTEASLNGRKVGVQLGSVEEETAKQISGATIIPLNSLGSIVQEIKIGRIDAAIIENTVAKAYVSINSGLEFHTIASNGETGSAIAFPKGSELTKKFNLELQKMQSSGIIEQLINTWFGENSPAYTKP
ncbi:MAG: transporter substrate-binding domain-containing protein [Synechococcales cyanobacterium]